MSISPEAEALAVALQQAADVARDVISRRQTCRLTRKTIPGQNVVTPYFVTTIDVAGLYYVEVAVGESVLADAPVFGVTTRLREDVERALPQHSALVADPQELRGFLERILPPINTKE